MIRAAALALALLVVGAGWSYTATAQAYKVLVFHRTAGFRHTDSINAGITTIQQLGVQHGFGVDVSQDASAINAANLAQYRVLVFLSTTGDFLDATQQTALEGYVRAGGGWVGIHAASDAEYSWPWYGGLVGAFFDQHPATQPATINVENRSHPSTAHLGTTWPRTDEWYNFRETGQNIRGRVTTLMALDETSYTGGTMQNNHPIAWYQLYDGGRSWYTALGHTAESFAEPAFKQHILGGIQWAAERMAQASPSAAPSGSAAPSAAPAPSASAAPSGSAAPSPSASSSPAPALPRRCFLPLTQN